MGKSYFILILFFLVFVFFHPIITLHTEIACFNLTGVLPHLSSIFNGPPQISILISSVMLN